MMRRIDVLGISEVVYGLSLYSFLPPSHSFPTYVTPGLLLVDPVRNNLYGILFGFSILVSSFSRTRWMGAVPMAIGVFSGVTALRVFMVNSNAPCYPEFLGEKLLVLLFAFGCVYLSMALLLGRGWPREAVPPSSGPARVSD
jgi:uncharacterized membrane protein